MQLYAPMSTVTGAGILCGFLNFKLQIISLLYANKKLKIVSNKLSKVVCHLLYIMV